MSDKGYREKCIEEKGEACDICGRDEVVVHHIDGDRSNNSIDNLVPLCHSHHLEVHSTVPASGDIEKYQQQLPPETMHNTPRPSHKPPSKVDISIPFEVFADYLIKYGNDLTAIRAIEFEVEKNAPDVEGSYNG